MSTRNSVPTEHLISRKIEIDAAHRVLRHHSKCKNLHGHRYVVEAWCLGSLDNSFQGSQEGMVLDFGFLKEEMVETIDRPCDHAAIFSVEDPILEALVPDMSACHAELAGSGFVEKMSTFGRLYIIPFVPTAENLARHWYERLEPRVTARTGGRARLAMIKVWETPNCWASYGPSAEAVQAAAA